MTRIKRAELVDKERGLIRITLEEAGEEYEFAGDAWELLDQERVLEILQHWKTKVIPRRRAYGKLTDTEKERKVKELEGIEV